MDKQKQQRKASIARAKARPAYRKPRVDRQVRQAAKGKYQISNCAQEYIHSLVDPWNAGPACIPSSFPLPSSKEKYIVSGKFALGTTGYGFIEVSPSICSDAGNMIITTTAASVMGAGTLLNAVTNTQVVQNTKARFVNADFTNNSVQGRVVSCGLRIRYIGREDARNGVIILLEEPDHLTLNTQSASGITNKDQALRVRPTDEWASLCYSGPVAPGNIEYQNSTNPLTANYILGAIIEGTAGDAYEFEVVVNAELIGTTVHGRSPSHSDEQAYGKALAATKEATKDSVLTPEKAPSVFNRFVNSMIESAPMLLEKGRDLMGVLELDPSSILRTALKGLSSTSRPTTGHRLMGTGYQGFLGM